MTCLSAACPNYDAAPGNNRLSWWTISIPQMEVKTQFQRLNDVPVAARRDRDRKPSLLAENYRIRAPGGPLSSIEHLLNSAKSSRYVSLRRSHPLPRASGVLYLAERAGSCIGTQEASWAEPHDSQGQDVDILGPISRLDFPPRCGASV
jgi:hypothetical protein